MNTTKKQWFQAFVSLTWYEILLRFIATFIAKTSELLLAAGLVVSSANFLTDGDVLGTATLASRAWAWTQALAIDSSLAISFYYVLQCLKQRDWTKFVLYSVLTLLLALVAGTITNIDIYSHAIHASIGNAMKLIGVNVELLSTLRAVAVVGFVLMSRLRDVSFKDLYTQDDASLPQEQATEPQQTASVSKEANRLSVDEVATLIHALSSRGTTSIQEAPDELRTQQVAVHEEKKFGSGQQSALLTNVSDVPVPQLPAVVSRPNKKRSVKNDTPTVPEEPLQQGKHELAEQGQLLENLPEHFEEAGEQEVFVPTSQSVLEQAYGEAQQEEPSQDQRLEQAYQALKAEGRKPSGRALAERAHIHRSTCNAWLKAHTPKKSLKDRNGLHVDTVHQEQEK